MGEISPARDRLHLGAPEPDVGDIATLVDELGETLAIRDSRDAVRLVQGLIQCSERYFRREQAILRRQGFPRLHEHARRHESALLLLEQLDACLADGRLAGATVVYDDLCAFLDGARSRQKAEYAAFLAKSRPFAATAHRR